MKVKTVKTYDFSTGKFKPNNELKVNLKMNKNYFKLLSVSPYPITSFFGQQETFRSKPHSGLDFKMETGEPLRSIKQGVVSEVFDYGNRNAGLGVKVRWENGQEAIYGHMSDVIVKEGQRVDVGSLLGHSGNTGFSTGSHLHFGLKEGSKYIDPSPYIDHIQNMNNPNLLAKLNQIQQNVNNFGEKSYSFSELFNFSPKSFTINLISLFDNFMFF